ncbi:YraN family protein [Pelagibacterium xiamenense]|uniref:YraN family protein n=1 Tax=Pelagibacterium xiamenense TaxID=2901140 RepID=UPI001E3CE4D5|nr:YraN family protein [Pelagibacterium xiamenense]MCD7058468.1 YraN family protein [Pelagibacterium xiamenense]
MPPSDSRPGLNRRQAAERRGRRGELWAELFLRAKLYKTLYRRYRTPSGEIDLIVRRGRTIVFVEVKQRASAAQYGEAMEAVNTRRISGAAGWFESRHPQYSGFDYRFDVIFLAPGRWPSHLSNAFFAH